MPLGPAAGAACDPRALVRLDASCKPQAAGRESLALERRVQDEVDLAVQEPIALTHPIVDAH